MEDNVILYHQNGCGMCRAVKMLLERKNINYQAILITTDNVNEYINKGITCTPTLVVNGKNYVKKECLDWINAQ